jgi:hypothetical protein
VRRNESALADLLGGQLDIMFNTLAIPRRNPKVGESHQGREDHACALMIAKVDN